MPFSGEEGGENEAILCISDWHVGATVNRFINKFNHEILKKRVKKVQDDAIRYCALHNVKVLHVLNLGDMIDGNIHVSGRVTAEFDVVTQAMSAAALIYNLLTNLSEKNRIRYIPECP